MREMEQLELELLESASYLDGQYALENYQAIQESMLQRVPAKLVSNLYGISERQNKKIISEALNNLTSVAVDTQKTGEFFSKVYTSVNLDNIPITTPLRDIHEVELIRPAYLDMYISEVEKAAEEIANGKLKDQESLQPKGLDPKVVLAFKKRMVRTTLPYDQTYKVLIRTTAKTVPCEVTEEFLTATVMPFLRTYQDDVKTITKESSAIMNSMTEGFSTLASMTKTYNDMAGNKLSPEVSDLMAYYLFNAGRVFLDLVNYACFMITRKMNNYMFNINALTDLYNKIMSYYPEGNSILHESVLDGSLADIDDMDMVFSLLNGNCNVFCSVVRRILDSHRTDLLVRRGSTGDGYGNSVLQSQITDHDYDRSPYSSVNDIFASINQSLDTFLANAKDPYMSLDDVKEKAGLNMSLSSRFGSQLVELADVSTYTDQLENPNHQFSDQDVLYCIINELENFEGNMKEITSYIESVYAKIKSLDVQIYNNINNEYGSMNLGNEMHEFLLGLEHDYRDLILLVAQKLMMRLNELDHTAYTITSEDPNGDPLAVDDENDYLKEAVESILDDDAYMFQSNMRSMREYYEGETLKSVLGVNIFLEADQPTGDNKPNDQGGNQQGDAKQGSPQVNVGTQDQNGQNDTPSNDQNQDQNAQNADGKKEGTKKPEDKKAMMQKFKEFFQNIINKFRDMIQKQSKGNLKWLNDHKEELLNRKLRGTDVNNFIVYDKEVPKRVQGELGQVSNAIKGLNDNNLGTMDNAGIDKHLFGFITISADKPMRDKIVQWYTTGTAETKPQTLRNSQIEKEIPGMIDYCIEYYTSLQENILKQYEDIMNAWASRGETLKADDDKIAYVNKQIKYYGGAVMNALRNRCYAYLKILRALVPQAKPAANQNENQNQNQEAEQGQGNEGNTENNQ